MKIYEERLRFSRETIEQAKELLEGEAFYRGQQERVYTRVAYVNDRFYYDSGEYFVEADADNWRITDSVPVNFVSYTGNKSQVRPISGGKIDELLGHFNIQPGCDLLIKTFILTSMHPDIDHPILVIHGPQGAGKTTLLKAIQNTIDPSAVTDIEAFDRRSFEQGIAHRWFVPLDNKTRFKQDMSDLLCKLVTGASSIRRELYTTDDEMVRAYRRVVAITGINIPADRADLLDRCLFVEVDRIDGSQRRNEAELSRDLNAAIPAALGWIFDTLVKILKMKNLSTTQSLPRLAGYAVWSLAACRALGIPETEFTRAFEANRRVQNEEALEGSPLARVLISMLSNGASFRGTPTELFYRVKNFDHQSVGIDPRYLPISPKSLGKKLVEIKSNLEGVGFTVSQRRGKERTIIIEAPKREHKNVEDVETSSPSKLGDQYAYSFREHD